MQNISSSSYVSLHSTSSKTFNTHDILLSLTWKGLGLWVGHYKVIETFKLMSIQANYSNIKYSTAGGFTKIPHGNSCEYTHSVVIMDGFQCLEADVWVWVGIQSYTIIYSLRKQTQDTINHWNISFTWGSLICKNSSDSQTGGCFLFHPHLTLLACTV